jgi:hypothetical protein
VVGDYTNQHRKTAYYDNVNYEQRNDSTFVINAVNYEDKRAFNNIKEQLWSGYDNFNLDLLTTVAKKDSYFKKYLDFNFKTFDIQPKLDFTEKLKIAGFNMHPDSFIVFLQNKVASVYLDCLYFSTITTATIGYGDIAPTNTLAKVLVIIQVFCNLFLLIISLNLAITNFKE